MPHSDWNQQWPPIELFLAILPQLMTLDHEETGDLTITVLFLIGRWKPRSRCAALDRTHELCEISPVFPSNAITFQLWRPCPFALQAPALKCLDTQSDDWTLNETPHYLLIYSKCRYLQLILSGWGKILLIRVCIMLWFVSVSESYCNQFVFSECQASWSKKKTKFN